jgi:hypothetical protein
MAASFRNPIVDMRLDNITRDELGGLTFRGISIEYQQCLQGRRLMLGKAREWGMVGAMPKVKLAKERAEVS